MVLIKFKIQHGFLLRANLALCIIASFVIPDNKEKAHILNKLYKS